MAEEGDIIEGEAAGLLEAEVDTQEIQGVRLLEVEVVTRDTQGVRGHTWQLKAEM